MRGRLSNTNGAALPRTNTSPFPNLDRSASNRSDGPFNILITSTLEDSIRAHQYGDDYLERNSCFRTDLPLEDSRSRVDYFAVPCANVRKATVPRFSLIPRRASKARNVNNNTYVLFSQNTNLDVGVIQGFAPGSVGAAMGNSTYQLVELCSTKDHPCTINFHLDGNLHSLSQN
jgi:hypothetical protein